ncbi:MAG TPA: phosphate signaling complex protein PhoU [Edaphocola sp.]|nr:phosphate signaling complex protein PhoU [Edaphocola sp.]
MAQIENALNQIRTEVFNMWTLAENQLEKAKTALLHFDQDLAREVKAIEKRVNATELKIDRDCEHLLALHAPVAVDLRFVLAILKINTSLERVGDTADSIAKYILHQPHPYPAGLLEQSGLSDMFDQALSILSSAREAFGFENTRLARTIFHQDEVLNDMNAHALPFAVNYIKENPAETEAVLNTISIMRRLERIGDHAKNIAEETIFYVEAKVLKHKILES